MFIGGYFHSLDDKCRVVIPPPYRSLLGERFVITKGLHGCLWILKQDNWAVIQQRIIRKPQQRDPRSPAVPVRRRRQSTPDNQGRILIPPVLRDAPASTKTVVIIGASNRVELWAKEVWVEYNANLKDEDIEACLARVNLS